MKKIIIIILTLILSTNIVFWDDNNIDNLQIQINSNIISWITLQENLEKIVNKLFKNDLEKKEIIYKKLSIEIDKINENSNENLNNIKKVIDYSLEKTTKELDIYYNQVKKITLWYTKTWLPIYAYYSWNPNYWYFWIFANIHWWYEYWAYETANYLINKFQNSWVTWWFIIPTINPEWLEYYKNSTIKYDAYLEWRVNSNNVDLNRNFCSKNFELKTFIKNWLNIKTGINLCNSESETKIIIDTLKKYKFNNIVSLHSEWEILYIPDNSIDDERIKNLWNQISSILHTYDFDLSYKNEAEKNQKIKKYEINEWWDSDYTWTMETYIYENYNIPTIIVEIYKHWIIEYNLKNIVNIDDFK